MAQYGGILATDDYRNVLEMELEKRRTRNPRYSMRAFARDIGIRSNRLSEILNGKQGLSPGFAESIAPKLGLRDLEAKFFLDLVTMAHGRRRADRMAAARRLSEYQKAVRVQEMEINRFQTISGWHHIAIIELSKVEGFVPTTDWVAGRLGIPTVVVEDALNRLEMVGLLDRNAGKWTFKSEEVFLVGGASVEPLKKYHTDVMNKALAAIKSQSSENRELVSMTVAIDRAQLPKVKERIRQFLEILDRDLSESQKKTDVYNLSVQFFSLMKDNSNA